MIALIPNPEVFVQYFIQLLDIIFWIGQNKNTLILLGLVAMILLAT